jgi:murein DD-endopeptidase MepM/ murein hydrolase activator NlpD
MPTASARRLILLLWWLIPVPGWAMAQGSRDLKDPCSDNSQCTSGYCDAGWGTSQTNRCVPGPGGGRKGDYCSNHNQCRSAKCDGLRKSSSGGWIGGKCRGQKDLGETCSTNPDCESLRCDRGWGTSHTERCVPGPNAGRAGDYCSNDNQCALWNCAGNEPTGSGGSWTGGHCATKLTLGTECTNHKQCMTEACHPGDGFGCVPQNGEGDEKDFCTHDRQCSTAHCASLMTRQTGECAAAVTDPASYYDKTRIYVQNDTNQWLLLMDYDVSSSLEWDTGRHFWARKPSDELARYPMEDNHPLRHAGMKAVPPGERVQVAWFRRTGLGNGQSYSFELKVGMEPTAKNETVLIKSKLRGEVIGSAIWFGLNDSAWHSDTSWHRDSWRVVKTKVTGRRWVPDGSPARGKVESYQLERDQDIAIKYRALTRPGPGGDLEYVFTGPTPPVRFSFPVTPRGRILTGMESVGPFNLGPFHMDHNPWPRLDPLACSDYAGRGNDLSGPHCYGAHEGNDFALIGGFDTMRRADTWAVAAADGTVLEVKDGHPDKCGLDFNRIDHIDDFFNMLKTPTCPAGQANFITVDHGEGIRTQYYHLKKNSMQVAPGDRVRCGQKLAEIGSSGRSTMPHLHFNVIDNGAHVDPFDGIMSTRGFWSSQGPGRVPLATCP